MDKRRIEMNVLNAYWDNENIDKVIEELEEAKKKGATNVCFDDGEGVQVEIYYNRLETDDEFEVRKLRIANRQELLKKRELEQLARLKAKYENGKEDNTENSQL